VRFIIDHAFLHFSNASTPLIDINNLHFNWAGIATLSGPSGSGKTTLFRLITGWYDRYFTGKAYISYNGFDVFKTVRMIGGHASLFPWKSILSNVRLRVGISDIHELEDIFNSVGLDVKVLKMYPYELSLGMYKRVELIVATLERPKILFLDEFFSSIDYETKQLVRKFLMHYRDDGLTMASVHEKDLIEWIGGTNFTFIRDNDAGTITGLAKS
jgi:ABC-type nitrate/sulfonate/bicarbonate transport system ATPase subunit